MAESALRANPAKDRPRLLPQTGRKRSRIGVLPFLPDRVPEDEDFAVSISDAIAVALAQCASCDVIPPRSLTDRSAIAAAAIAANEIADLDHVVEGAVSSDDGRLHVTVRLLDLRECARTVWSDRVVVSPGRLLKSAQLIALRIVGGIDPVTLFFDGRARQRKRDGTTGLLLSAIQLMSTLERRKYEEAGRLIDRALQIEPDNAMASAWAAFWQVVYVGQGWTQNLMKASAIAQARAWAAVRSNPDDAETLAICGHVSSFLGRDYDTALYYFDRAQRLDASLEFPWLWSALTYCYSGKPGAALERLEHYRALTSTTPINPWTQNICSIAYMFSGNYDKAVEFSRPMTRATPGFVNGYKPLIASLGHLGRAEEAKPYLDKLLALEPNFTVERFAKVYPIKHDSDREHYMKGLRLAGVPER
jgi:tetratricopeptide (TPR) repeat protein/TolB-like protein